MSTRRASSRNLGIEITATGVHWELKTEDNLNQIAPRGHSDHINNAIYVEMSRLFVCSVVHGCRKRRNHMLLTGRTDFVLLYPPLLGQAQEKGQEITESRPRC